MIDRRKIAVLLLVLGAGLTVVSSFQQTYTTVYRGFGSDQAMTTTLWIVTSESMNGPPDGAFPAVGWSVVIAAVFMVVAAVLTLQGRMARVARPVAMGSAGVLTGVVLVYVLQVRREAKALSEWPAGDEQAELIVHGGLYLLVAGAVAGFIGAVLAQWEQKREERPQEEQVVVHQLGNDDDTPPFGIAIPQADEQETR